MVYWSRAFYNRERHENESFLTFIEKLKANPNGFRITAAQSRSLQKFCKKELLNKETGEVLDSGKLLAMIDDEKLTEFNELMGYYQIVTSELDLPDREVIDRYHGLTRIEDQFREMKGTLETRPIFVRTPEHIQAHMMICFMALTMLRVMQYRVKKSLPPEYGKDLNWTYGLPGERLSKALLDWNTDQLSEAYYRLSGYDSEDLKLLLSALGVTIPVRLFTVGELQNLKSSVSLF